MPQQSDPRNRRDTRRSVLAGVLAGLVGLSGCLGDDDTPTDDGADEDGRPTDDLNINGRRLDHSFPIRLYVPNTNDVIVDIHYHEEHSHWHSDPLELPLDDSRQVEVRLYDDSIEVLPLGPDEAYRIDVRLTEDTPADLVDVAIDGEMLTLSGASSGTGAIRVDLIDTDAEEVVWTTIPLSIIVE